MKVWILLRVVQSSFHLESWIQLEPSLNLPLTYYTYNTGK